MDCVFELLYAHLRTWHPVNCAVGGSGSGRGSGSGSGAGGVNLCVEVLYLRDKINQPKAFNHR